jgi:hypothetical protein
MALCSVADVRARIYTSTLVDADIIAIIADVSGEVYERAGLTDDSNATLILAGKNAAYAATLRRMRTTGELASRVKNGNSEAQNTIDKDIQDYEDKATFYIRKYRSSGFSIVSGRMGFGTVDGES